MADFSLATKKFELYQQAKDAGLEGEFLEKFRVAVDEKLGGSEPDIMSREGRQEDNDKKVTEQKKQLARGYELVGQLRELGATPEMMEKADSVLERLRDPLDVTEEIRAGGALALEGLTGGLFGDEARAGIQAALTGGDYEYFLQEERGIEERMWRDNPATAATLSIGASLLPSSKIGKAIGVGKTAAGGAARLGGLAGTEGAVYGFMEGEGGVENRVVEALKYGGLGAITGGTVGAILGRSEGRAIKAAEDAATKLEIDDLQSKYLRGELTDNNGVKVLPKSDEVITAFQKGFDEEALAYNARTGETLSGLDYGKTLEKVAKDLNVPIKKLRHAEMTSGKTVINFDDITIKELRNRVGTLADDVGFNNGKYNPNKIQSFIDDKFRSVARMAGKHVGPRFGSVVQRTASNMAKRHAETENIITAPNVVKFADSQAKDPEIKRLLLNMSNVDIAKPTANLAQRKEAYRQLTAHIKNTYGQEALDGFETMRRKIQTTGKTRREYVDRGMPDDQFYWPSQKMNNQTDAWRFASTPRKTNSSAGQQTREQFDEIGFNAAEYEDPMVVAQDWLRRSDSEIEMFRQGKYQNLDTKRRELANKAANGSKADKKKLKQYERRILNGTAPFDEVRRAVRLEGGDSLTAAKAADTMMSVVNMGSRGPSGIIANLRKAAYMGTIGNPYSAILNLGDVFNSMVNYGGDNTLDSVVDMFRKRGIDVTVNDIGLGKQATGELVREGATGLQRRFNSVSNKVFEGSGFGTVDRFGKNVALRAGLKEGQKLAREGKLQSEWGHAFTKQEMARLQRDLLKGEKSDIVVEFAAAQLAKLQPSDMAQMPKWYLDNPNWRVLYMLRTFGLKQLEQIERLVIEEYKAGNKKEAFKNAMAYTAIVGGGNAALNEGRQVLKGNEPQLENLPMRWADHMLGATTINTLGMYQMVQMAKGDTSATVASVAPAPLSMILAPAVDIVGAGAGRFDDTEEFLEDSETLGWLPWGRLVQSWAKDK